MILTISEGKFMENGFIENGFIVDLSNAQKTSEIIYELSRILDIPEAQNKQVCLKLGNIPLSIPELTSIKALVESMDSQIEFITTTSIETTEAAKELEINISELENVVEAPDFEMEPKVNPDVEHALDKIFGDTNFDEEPQKEVKEVEEPETHIEEEEEDDEETLALKEQIEKLPTLYIKRTIRSGQSITSDGNLTIIGDVNPGAEIIAKGDITVWGILGGIAHAGSEGNSQARIRALKMNPIQIRIAEIFARRPDGVNIPFVQKTNEFIPEEAKAHKNNIVINKLLEI